MSGSISSLFSSGEIKSIVGQLQTRLQAPITVEQIQIKQDTVQISALGSIQSALSSLNGSLSGIATPSSINSMSATPSNSNVTATAQSSAATGTYSLTGITLAHSQEIYTPTYASASAKIGSGSGGISVKFASGASAHISVPSGQNTVTGIAAAINAANKGVTASVVSTASGDRLVLAGASTGSGQAFSLTGSGALSGLKYASGSASATMTLGQAARNASFTMNGVPITESSNSNLSLVQGVNLNLVASGSANVNVAVTTSGLSSALSTFTSKLNGAVSAIAKQTAFTPAKSSASASSGNNQSSAGPLLGNVQVEQLGQALLSAVSSVASSGLSAASIGLSVSSGGRITFSSSTLTSAYAKNPTAVNNLVQMVEQSVKNVVTGAIGYAGATPSSGSGTAASSGFIQTAISDLKTTDTGITQQIAQQQLLDEQQISNLESEFAAATAATSGTNTTLAYLGTMLPSKSSSGG